MRVITKDINTHQLTTIEHKREKEKERKRERKERKKEKVKDNKKSDNHRQMKCDARE
jgi:hypothetical protein